MTTFQRPSDILITSWLFTVQRKFGLTIKEHKKQVDLFTAGTQTRASRARESSVTHKSAITDHAVEENHVIDWDKAKVVDREAQQQTRWIKEALWIRKTLICMNRDAGSYQLSHTWNQVISRSRAPLSCKLSRRDQNETLSLGNILPSLQWCRVRSFYKTGSTVMLHNYFISTSACLEPKLLTKWNVSSWRRHHNKMVWSAIALLVRLAKSAL